MMLTASSSGPVAPAALPASSLQSTPLSTSDPLDCNSSSPTNTSSGSDTGSALGSRFDLSSFLAASSANNLVGKAVDIFQQQMSQDSNSLMSTTAAANSAAAPLFGSDPATFLQFSQLLQAQQAIFQATQQQRVQQQLQSAQAQAQPPQQQERKRSYPCTFQFCVICQKDVHSSKLPCHIRQCHVAKPMFQCPACDFTSTYSKNNVKSHMVSLHGLAGDPISYMDKYAAQVEEFMKMCFPNVRGRGRPMQGRTSPRSPVSPLAAGAANARRTSQSSAMSVGNRRASVTQELISLQQQAILAAQTYNNRIRLNPLSIFPHVFNNNSSPTAVAAMSSTRQPAVKAEETAITGAEGTGAEQPTSGAITSMDEILNTLAHKANPPTRTNSMISGSIRSTVTQPVRPGENMQPRYLHTEIGWSVLNEEQAKTTIFAELSQIENAGEKFDISLFSTPESPQPLLSEEQAAKIAAVREQLKLQLFEVMFAVHRMDLTVLGPELVRLVAEIAPTSADAVRMRQFESVATVSPPLGENEKFLLALSKIDRLEEKLFVMQHMALYKLQVDNIQESLNNLTDAAKALTNSGPFKQLLQWILVLTNFFIGDASGKSIKGFRTSQINEICARTLQSGETLLSLLAGAIQLDSSEMKSVVHTLLPVISKASQEVFLELSSTFCRLEEANVLAERELEFSTGANVPLQEFLEQARSQVNGLFDSIMAAKEELISLLSFFGEPIPRTEEPFQPEAFFGSIATFLTSLQAAMGDEKEKQEHDVKVDEEEQEKVEKDSGDTTSEQIRVSSP